MTTISIKSQTGLFSKPVVLKLSVCVCVCVQRDDNSDPQSEEKNNKAESELCCCFSLFHYCFSEFLIFNVTNGKISFKKTLPPQTCVTLLGTDASVICAYSTVRFHTRSVTDKNTTSFTYTHISDATGLTAAAYYELSKLRITTKRQPNSKVHFLNTRASRLYLQVHSYKYISDMLFLDKTNVGILWPVLQTRIQQKTLF